MRYNGDWNYSKIVAHGCVEFDDGTKTGIDIVYESGVHTIGCEDWMLR